MTFKNKLFEEFSAKWAEVIEKSPVKDIEKNLKAMLTAIFEKLDLVTREEFDVQVEVLARTREKVSELEKMLVEIEKQTKQ